MRMNLCPGLTPCFLSSLEQSLRACFEALTPFAHAPCFMISIPVC
jgi:hypothetical protein